MTYVESSVHCLSKPDVFEFRALAGPPVLARNFGRLGVDAGLSCLHVAEDFDRINGAALIRINPVLAYRQNRKEGQKSRLIYIYKITSFYDSQIVKQSYPNTSRRNSLYLTSPQKDRADDTEHSSLINSSECHSPLFQSGWQSFRSLHVRAGFFLDPSGLRMFSIWLLSDLSVASTSASC